MAGSRRRTGVVSGLVLFLIALAAFGVYRWRVGAAFDSALERIRDAGYPTNLAELDAYYAAPPFGENRADFLLLAIGDLVIPGSGIEADLPISGNADLPPPYEPIPDAMRTAMGRHLEDNERALERIDDALKLSACRFPVNVHDGPNMNLEHLAQVRMLGRLLAVSAINAAETGDSAAAARRLDDVMEMADSLETEPTLISQLVRIAINGLALEALEQCINRADFREEDLAALQSRLESAEANRAFVRGLVGERCMWESFDALTSGSGTPSANPQSVVANGVYLPFGLTDLDRVRFLESFESLIAITELPPEAQMSAAEALEAELDDPAFYQILSSIMLPAVVRSVAADVRTRAQLRTAIVAVAAERYQRDHGTYPESAEALTPNYLTAIPRDPYSDGPIRYIRTEDGFVAYTLAENRTDERGAAGPSENKKWREGDWAIRIGTPPGADGVSGGT